MLLVGVSWEVLVLGRELLDPLSPVSLSLDSGKVELTKISPYLELGSILVEIWVVCCSKPRITGYLMAVFFEGHWDIQPGDLVERTVRYC
jgi:hypothetical protein